MDKKPTYDELASRLKELEKELRDAKRDEGMLPEAETLKRLLEVAPFGIFLIDLSGKILTCNENGAGRLGKPIETAVGTVLRDYFPPEVSENRRLKGMEAIQSRNAITFEDHVEGRWYRNSIAPFFDKKGKPVRLAIYGADVTEYKNAADALEKSEEKYRQLAELLPQVVFEMDENGNITFANRTAFDLFGYTSADFEKGVNALQMLIPENRERAVANMQKALSGEKFGGTEYTVLTKSGRTYPVVLYSNAILKEGQPVGLRGIMVDLTEIKQAQEALRESEERYRILVEESPLGVSLIGKDGRYRYLNPKFTEIFGYTFEEIPTGKEWFRQAYPDEKYRKAVLADWMDDQKRYGIGESRPRAYQVTCKDGSKKMIHFRPVTMESGDQLVIYEDVTETHRLEEQLRRAQKMEALGLLAGGVAHDLNNILSGIVSYPELILMDLPEGSPLRKPMKTIHESGMRAAGVVSDLLTIARGVATGKETLNLNTIVSEYMGSAEFQNLEETNTFVHFRSELDPHLLNMGGSPIHLKKTLMNLVTNASEAIESEGTVTISTFNRFLDEPLTGYDNVRTGEYVVLSVSDNGRGISSRDMERIFEPFYTKKVMGRSGTGLGLAVVWNTVQDHNGYIHVKSSEKGTVFELYFPVTRREIAAAKEPVDLKDYMGRGERILVVDDEESQREIAIGLLTKLGYRAEAVSSGEEAIEYVKTSPVDLIVLDMMMPKGINGREAYDEIIKVQPGQKAIIASGYAQTEQVDAAQKLGAGKYIKKPYTLEKIGLAVKEELMK